METFRRRKNVAVKIFEIECIFGLDWTVDEIRPWTLVFPAQKATLSTKACLPSNWYYWTESFGGSLGGGST
jgi:hypothetical protein